MEDPRWLKIVTVGLILAILAVVYFLLTGGFAVSKAKKTQTQVQTQTTQTSNIVVSPTPFATPTAGSSTKTKQSKTPSAYSTISNRTQTNVQTLPSTGFPAGLSVVFSISAIISGLSLRKFPK